MTITKDLTPVIKAMLADSELKGGGIFQKEKYYMEKYNISEDDMNKMQGWVYRALHPDQWQWKG